MQKKQSEAYERITRSNPKGIKPKIVINQINIKMNIFGNNFLTKNPFTKCLIKNAEYKYGQTSENAAASEAYVQLTLTQDAVQKFADATQKA